MLSKSSYATSNLMEIVMVALYVTIFEIFIVNICLTVTFAIGQDQVKIFQKIAHARILYRYR